MAKKESNTNKQEGFSKMSINWVRRIYGKLAKSIENTDFFIKHITYFYKNKTN